MTDFKNVFCIFLCDILVYPIDAYWVFYDAYFSPLVYIALNIKVFNKATQWYFNVIF